VRTARLPSGQGSVAEDRTPSWASVQKCSRHLDPAGWRLTIVCVTCNVLDMPSTRDRVRQHRERLRRQGLRPLQIWVPDVRAPEFIAEAHRQSVAVATSEREADDQAFVDAISSPWEDENEEASSR
jgi:hypothetical protein